MISVFAPVSKLSELVTYLANTNTGWKLIGNTQGCETRRSDHHDGRGYTARIEYYQQVNINTTYEVLTLLKLKFDIKTSLFNGEKYEKDY